MPQQVYAGTDWGVYYTDDITVASPTWQRFENGIPHAMVWDMQIDRGSTTLSVWTRSRGRVCLSLAGRRRHYQLQHQHQHLPRRQQQQRRQQLLQQQHLAPKADSHAEATPHATAAAVRPDFAVIVIDVAEVRGLGCMLRAVASQSPLCHGCVRNQMG